MAVPPCKPVRFLCECDDSCSFVGSQGLPEVLCGAAHIVPRDGDGDDGLRADERHALSVSAEDAVIRGYFSQADTQYCRSCCGTAKGTQVTGQGQMVQWRFAMMRRSPGSSTVCDLFTETVSLPAKPPVTDGPSPRPSPGAGARCPIRFC